jgi:hypothetical protein
MAEPGQINVVSQDKNKVFARLFNFGIARHELKAKHTDWLKKNVVPILRRNGSLAIMGIASPTGSVDFNRILSRRRADEVVNYLRRESPNNFKIRLDMAAGEALSRWWGVPDGMENENWRGVVLLVWDKPTPPPPPPPPPKPVSRADADVSRLQRVAFMTDFSQSPDPMDPSSAQRLNDWAMRRNKSKSVKSVGLKSEMVRVPASYRLIRIFTFRMTSDFNVGISTSSTTGCLVYYQWGVSNRSPFCYLFHGYWRDGAFANEAPFMYELPPQITEQWLIDPREALDTVQDWDRSGSLIRKPGNFYNAYWLTTVHYGEPPRPPGIPDR